MKIRKSILTATTGVLLAAFGGMALASPTPQKPSSSTATKQPCRQRTTNLRLALAAAQSRRLIRIDWC